MPHFGSSESLVHLGLGFNQISDITVIFEGCNLQRMKQMLNYFFKQDFEPSIEKCSSRNLPRTLRSMARWYPSSLKSLDLSYNNLCSIIETVDALSDCMGLRILCLMVISISRPKCHNCRKVAF